MTLGNESIFFGRTPRESSLASVNVSVGKLPDRIQSTIPTAPTTSITFIK